MYVHERFYLHKLTLNIYKKILKTEMTVVPLFSVLNIIMALLVALVDIM